MSDNTERTYLENLAEVLIIAAIIFIMVGLLGIGVLRLLGLPYYNIAFSAVFGFGIIAMIAFIISIFEEIRS